MYAFFQEKQTQFNQIFSQFFVLSILYEEEKK